MTRIGVLGATGRMGRLVIDGVVRAPDLVLGAAITRSGSNWIGRDAGELCGAGQAGVPVTDLDATDLDALDVIIDFSTPRALQALLGRSGSLPLVTGTTGLPSEALDALRARAERAPMVVAANFSTGVALLRDLVERSARALPDYDIEIVEAHHRFKVDAPSGTALALGHAAARGREWDHDAVAVHGRHGAEGPRPTQEIGYHAVRGGGIVGEHEVWLSGPTERVRISHTALNRSSFADGAIRAARWVHRRPAGLFDMSDVLGLTAS